MTYEELRKRLYEQVKKRVLKEDDPTGTAEPKNISDDKRVDEVFALIKDGIVDYLDGNAYLIPLGEGPMSVDEWDQRWDKMVFEPLEKRLNAASDGDETFVHENMPTNLMAVNYENSPRDIYYENYIPGKGPEVTYFGDINDAELVDAEEFVGIVDDHGPDIYQDLNQPADDRDKDPLNDPEEKRRRGF